MKRRIERRPHKPSSAFFSSFLVTFFIRSLFEVLCIRLRISLREPNVRGHVYMFYFLSFLPFSCNRPRFEGPIQRVKEHKFFIIDLFAMELYGTSGDRCRKEM